jgi:hypothetical protein
VLRFRSHVDLIQQRVFVIGHIPQQPLFDFAFFLMSDISGDIATVIGHRLRAVDFVDAQMRVMHARAVAFASLAACIEVIDAKDLDLRMHVAPESNDRRTSNIPQTDHAIRTWRPAAR